MFAQTYVWSYDPLIDLTRLFLCIPSLGNSMEFIVMCIRLKQGVTLKDNFFPLVLELHSFDYSFKAILLPATTT